MILLFFSGIQTLFYSDAFGTNDGCSAIWLMILYLVGGYIRGDGRSGRGKATKFLVGYFVMTGFTWLSKLIILLCQVPIVPWRNLILGSFCTLQY